MSVLSDLLGLLGLTPPGGTPTAGLFHLPKWVPLPMSIDGPTAAAAPWGYRIAASTRDLSALQSRLNHLQPPLPTSILPALQKRGLVQPDPQDATKFQVNLILRIQYPADPAKPDQIAGTGKLPVVLLNHGQHHPNWKPIQAGGAGSAVTGIKVTPSYDGYGYLQAALAQNGIISVSVDHNFANFTDGHIETRADIIIAALTLLSAQAAAADSRLFGRLDFTNVGLMGHSRGGDAVIRAVQKITADPALASQYTVGAVCSLAPTDFTGAELPADQHKLGLGDTNFYLVVYGALDGDVFGGGATSYGGTGFRHYDRCEPQKAMVFLDNCCHNPFNTVWLADFNDTSDPRQACPAAHQSVAIDYIGDLFRWQLKGEALGGRFDGRTPGSAGQPAALQWRFGQVLRQVDDFESVTANDLGGTRSVTSPGNVPATMQDFVSVTIGGSNLEYNTGHQTRILHVDVTQPSPGGTRVLSTDIPGPSQDWSGLDTLIFSLSGWFDPSSPTSIAAASLPRVTITLIDSAAATASADFNVYGAALPSRPVFKRAAVPDGHGHNVLRNIALMRLETVPIALTAFTSVSLSAIAHVAVDIMLGNNTHVFVDNISVVKRQ